MSKKSINIFIEILPFALPLSSGRVRSGFRRASWRTQAGIPPPSPAFSWKRRPCRRFRAPFGAHGLRLQEKCRHRSRGRFALTRLVKSSRSCRWGPGQRERKVVKICYICIKILYLDMKRLILIFSVACFAAVSCVHASVNEAEQGDNGVVEYYVKYASDALGVSNVSYTDVDGSNVNLTRISSDSFERIVGPVTVGFAAQLSITPESTYGNVNARIEVKKGDSPFVVKTEDVSIGSGHGVTVSYTVK